MHDNHGPCYSAFSMFVHCICIMIMAGTNYIGGQSLNAFHLASLLLTGMLLYDYDYDCDTGLRLRSLCTRSITYI